MSDIYKGTVLWIPGVFFVFHLQPVNIAAVPCTLNEDDVLRCDAESGGATFYAFKDGHLHHFPTVAIYKSWGSPAPSVVAIGVCLAVDTCPMGADMQLNIDRTCTNGVGTDCAPGAALLAGQLTGCCPCRKADVTTKLYKSAAVDSSEYGLGPDCSDNGALLSKDTPLQYSGAKVTLATVSLDCPVGDYAMVTIDVSRKGPLARRLPEIADLPPALSLQGKASWVFAGHLKFCTDRPLCGSKVELGASCKEGVVDCCKFAEEGGHPQATCSSPGPGAPTVCMVAQGRQCRQGCFHLKVKIRNHPCLPAEPPPEGAYVIKPCPGSPAGVTCNPGVDSLSRATDGDILPYGCCACRKARVQTTAISSPLYGISFEPFCDLGDKRTLPANTVVHFTGTILYDYSLNGCTKNDYAEIVLPAPTPTPDHLFSSWGIPVADLAFCNDKRACGRSGELGAACARAGCCTVPAEGGHSDAICYFPEWYGKGKPEGVCGVRPSAGALCELSRLILNQTRHRSPALC